jgi:hypothetical protein
MPVYIPSEQKPDHGAITLPACRSGGRIRGLSSQWALLAEGISGIALAWRK